MGARVSGKSVGRHGLSLIEVLVALAVVVIALFAIAATQVAAFTANVQAREIAAVRDIATESIAEVKTAILDFAYSDGALPKGSNWTNLLDATGGTVTCGAPTLEGLVGDSGQPDSDDFDDCGGRFVVSGPDGLNHTVLWRFGVPGSAIVNLPATVAFPSGRSVTSPQVSLLQVRVRVDWERRQVARSIEFEDFIGCVDVDATLCPAGPPAGG